MKVQLRDVVNSKSALEELLTTQMPAKVSFAVAYNARHINAILTDFDKAHTALAATYGEKVTEGYKVPPKNQEKFQEELTELLDTEVDIDLREISEEQLKEISVTPGTIFGAWFMFTNQE